MLACFLLITVWKEGARGMLSTAGCVFFPRLVLSKVYEEKLALIYTFIGTSHTVCDRQKLSSFSGLRYFLQTQCCKLANLQSHQDSRIGASERGGRRRDNNV